MSFLTAKQSDLIPQDSKVLQSVTAKGTIKRNKNKGEEGRRGWGPSVLGFCSVWLFRGGGELRTSRSPSRGGRPSKRWWCWRRTLRDKNVWVTWGLHIHHYTNIEKVKKTKTSLLWTTCWEKSFLSGAFEKVLLSYWFEWRGKMFFSYLFY